MKIKNLKKKFIDFDYFNDLNDFNNTNNLIIDFYNIDNSAIGTIYK